MNRMKQVPRNGENWQCCSAETFNSSDNSVLDRTSRPPHTSLPSLPSLASQARVRRPAIFVCGLVCNIWSGLVTSYLSSQYSLSTAKLPVHILLCEALGLNFEHSSSLF